MPVKNKGRKPRNPKTKPYFPHGSGYWAAKLGGRLRYLARWETPLPEVERIYLERKAESEVAAARQAEAAAVGCTGAITIKDIANLYINSRANDVAKEALSEITWSGYKRSLAWVTKHIGARPVDALGPRDFITLNEQIGAHYGAKQHQHVVGALRMALHWAAENDYIERVPKYGTEFKAPGIRQHRRERAAKAYKLFTAPEIRLLVEQAEPAWKAMILLGINCAYLQSDLAELPIRFQGNDQNTLDLGDDPYIRFDRPKTGVRWKCTLWPETVTALKRVIGKRTKGLVFVTRKGQPLVHSNMQYDAEGRLLKSTNCDAIGKRFRELCKKTGCYTKGVGFSSLRSTFETQSWQLQNLSVAHQAAIHWVMGHVLSGPDTPRMADTYLQDVSTEALRLVTDKIRDWYLQPGK